MLNANEVRARVTGNATVFTIPKSLKIKNGAKYNVYQGRQGAIVYLPQRPNIFHDPKNKEIDFAQKEFNVGKAQGKDI